MNRVTTVNLNGSAFQLEEGGYDALRRYLDAAAAKLAGNPDRDEILSDIEQAIADKFRARLGAYKNVVTAAQAGEVIAEMGPVENDPDAATTAGTASDEAEGRGRSESAPGASPGAAPKRLYRLYDGAMVSGVCNGIGAYFNIDPTLVRLVFVFLVAVTAGGAALGYLAMVLLVPVARSDAEKNAAHGTNFTAQEFIRRAKAGYYESVKSFPDERARREWQQKVRGEMRKWGRSFESEMRRGTREWQQNWHNYWAEHAQGDAGWSVALPFLSLFQAALALACLLIVVSLLTTGGILGVVLPASVPVWLAVLLVLFAYGLVTLPLKTVRHVFYRGARYGGPPGPRVFVSFWDSAVWLAFVGVLIWLALRNGAMVGEAFQAIPDVFGQMIDSIRDWWHGR